MIGYIVIVIIGTSIIIPIASGMEDIIRTDIRINIRSIPNTDIENTEGITTTTTTMTTTIEFRVIIAGGSLFV